MYLTIFSSSSRVPLLFNLLALQLITRTFPFVYPLTGSIRSRDGVLSVRPLTVNSIGIPKTGHSRGNMISSGLRSKGTPCDLARLLAANT